MQIKALVGLRVGGIDVRRGAIVDLVDHRAQQLVKRGLCVPVQARGPLDQNGSGKKGGSKSRSKKEVAGKALARPSETNDPTGGPTGAANASSSSQEAPVSGISQSTPSGDGDA